MRKKKLISILAIAAALTVFTGISTGVTTAYLSTTPGKARNVITTGDISIDLTEDKWNPEGNNSVYPGQRIEKNPVIKNTGKNAAHVFCVIRIPVRNIETVSEDGHRTARAARELFVLGGISEKWQQISRYRENDSMVYVFGYNKILNPQESSSAVFDHVSVINFLEGELDETEKFTVDVQALAIQTGVDTTGGTPEQIYEKLLLQIDSDQENSSATASMVIQEDQEAEKYE